MSNEQIIALFDDTELTPEELSEGFDVEIETVKFALASGSIRYRKMMKKDPSLFNDSDMETATVVMRTLMESADNDNIRFKAAKFVINEKLGRHGALKEASVNINLFNFALLKSKAEEAINKGKIVEMAA